MLSELFIENIAVIERATIGFRGGFSVLSGETGAGKSIIIDALSAICGGRVSRDIIRTGQSKATVTAKFEQLAEQIISQMVSLGFDGDELLIKREIFSDGRNVCRINGQPATLSMLKSLGEQLIAIHGQHDGQNLLNEQLHIDYLDELGQLGPQLEDYLVHYEQLLALNRRIKAISMSTAEKQRRRQQISGQIAALSEANVAPGEQDNLLSRRSELSNASRISEQLSLCIDFLSGTGEQNGAGALCGQALSALTVASKYSTEAVKLSARLSEVDVLLSDIESEVKNALEKLEFSQPELERIERRLDLISTLTTRFGTPPDEFSQLENSLSAELSELDGAEEDIEALSEQYMQKRKHLSSLAEKLHKSRKKAADDMQNAIQSELKQLDMPSASFCALVEKVGTTEQAKFTKKGTDTVRFLLSANIGEQLKPLIKVASGGELSRIMLAMKNVLSGSDSQKTTVFDEIDSGVSGRAASKVGEKLYAISRGAQVLCVTHLPQIACLADNQYRIEKNIEAGQTFTSVRPLDNRGRAEELARLAAGLHVTEETMKSALELLKQAENYKNSLT